MNQMFKDLIGSIMEVYIDEMCVKSKQEESNIEHLTRIFVILCKFRMKLNSAKCVFGVSSGQFLGHVVSKLGIEPHPTQIKNLITEQEPRTIKDVQSLIGKIMALNRFIPRVFEKCRPFYKAIKGIKEINWGEE